MSLVSVSGGGIAVGMLATLGGGTSIGLTLVSWATLGIGTGRGKGWGDGVCMSASSNIGVLGVLGLEVSS